jgi:hypothetical protein
VLAPATLAALPSTRAIPDRDVFYVAYPIRSIHRRKFAATSAPAHASSFLLLNSYFASVASV